MNRPQNLTTANTIEKSCTGDLGIEIFEEGLQQFLQDAGKAFFSMINFTSRIMPTHSTNNCPDGEHGRAADRPAR